VGTARSTNSSPTDGHAKSEPAVSTTHGGEPIHPLAEWDLDRDKDTFNRLASTGNPLRDALTVLAAVAWWARPRPGIAEPLWTLIGLQTGGRLLAPPS
jgi:hypothetical protein